jgi:peptide/nickel transport system permease protein
MSFSVRMRLALEGLRENTRLVLKTWSGKIGVALLIIQLVIAIYAAAAYYTNGEARSYMSSQNWQYYYPRNAPPCWAVSQKAGKFEVTKDDFTKSVNVTIEEKKVGLFYKYEAYTITTTYNASFTYTSKTFPQDLWLLILVHINKTVNPNVKPILPPKLKAEIIITRPDGLEIKLYESSLPLYPNLTSYDILIAGVNTSKAGTVVYRPIRLGELQEETSNPYDLEGSMLQKAVKPIFDKLNPSEQSKYVKSYGLLILATPDENGNATVLQGTYTITLRFTTLMDSIYHDKGFRVNASIGKFLLKPVPNCYGFFGTDDKARPIGLGLLLGFPYAFLLGFIVTFTSTFVGAIYGTIAGYWKDYKGEAMMRVADVFLSLPFLPILIALSYVFKGEINIWMLSFLMIVLFWAGPVIVVRSMALQISEQTYVEAAKAVGASTWRIVFRHIFPQIFPYTLAIAVLSIPGIIIAEASLSLLGLGDPTAPTWGKLLQEAYDIHAVQNGLWWLYIFPGLALVVFSATFLLIGRAVEPLVAPKLQR